MAEHVGAGNPHTRKLAEFEQLDTIVVHASQVTTTSGGRIGRRV